MERAGAKGTAVCRGSARGRQVGSDSEDEASGGVNRVFSVPIKSGWIRRGTSTTVSSLVWNPRKKFFTEKLSCDTRETTLKVSIKTLHGIKVETRGLRIAKRPISGSAHSTDHNALPDTGAQINLAGRNLMRAMQVEPDYLHKNNH